MYQNRLKELREETGTKQQALADLIGVTRSCYAHYEIEDDIIPLIHLNTICNFFHVSFDYIFELNKKKTYSNLKSNLEIKKIGQNLKEFRKEQHLTQNELANILKTHQTTITKYEKGNNLIATPFLYTICKKYQVSADYLLGKIDNPKNIK